MSKQNNYLRPEGERLDWCINLGCFLLDNGLELSCELREFNCFIVVLFKEEDPLAYQKTKRLLTLLNLKPSPDEPARWSAQSTGYAHSIVVDVPIEFHKKNVPTSITKNNG